MSDTSADAGVVQSRVQLERLVAEDELAGRTIAGFAAPSVGLRSVDLDSVTIQRLDLRGGDADDTRLERASLQIGFAKSDLERFPNAPDPHAAAYYFWLFPNLMLNFYPWGLSINVVEPLSRDGTRIRFRVSSPGGRHFVCGVLRASGMRQIRSFLAAGTSMVTEC
mgnify:CR=1 FL=1